MRAVNPPKVALVYPPTCDPTAPYLAIPTLAAWLRKHGVEVLPIDANLEAWEFLLSRPRLDACALRIEQRIAELDARSELGHEEKLIYAAAWQARGEAAEVPPRIEEALSVLRDPHRFYDADQYEAAVSTIDGALRVVSAAHAPLSLDFVAYKTPFSLLTPDEIARDASRERDPFHDYFVALAERLRAARVTLVGISVAFPGQVQPAYSLAYVLRERLPGVHVTVGGPALTQLLLRLDEEKQERVLGPFHSAVVYEGELALLDLVRDIERGAPPRGVVRGRMIEDMSILPPPDFDGLPLDRYLTPELVLPYDPSRGCYWGVCTFCHYGLAEVGTARYRERPVEAVLDHLADLAQKHGTKVFYFSQDVFSPRVATSIARGIRARGLGLRWGSDMRPERSLTPERCAELALGGALSAALGVESAAPRVLSLIDKGIPAPAVKKVIHDLSQAGVAVEAMCFSDFPSETYREALETVRFVDGLKDDLSLFILGRFDLTHGSLVAQKPGEFGIKEVWQIEGDELGTGLFYAERRRPKSARHQAQLEDAIRALSGGWRLRRYPWAGALSTAHTMLWYVRHGKDAFRHAARASDGKPGTATYTATARYDVSDIIASSAESEAAIWHAMVHVARRVTRDDYQRQAAALASARPAGAPRLWAYRAGADPVRAAAHPATAKARPGRPRGRRPSHSANATKP